MSSSLSRFNAIKTINEVNYKYQFVLPLYTDVVKGSIIRINPFKSSKITINKVNFSAVINEPDSGVISPTNLAVIEPVNEINIVACNNNIFGKFNTETKNGVTLTANSNGTITLNGTATADTTFTIDSEFKNLLAKALCKTELLYTDILFSMHNTVGTPNIVFYASNNDNIFNLYDPNTYGLQTYSATEIGDDSFNPTLLIEKGTTLSNFIIKPRAELDHRSRYTDFVQPEVTTHTISFSSSLGGGYIDYTNSKLYITQDFEELTGTNRTFFLDSHSIKDTVITFYSNLTNNYLKRNKIICTHFPTTNSTNTAAIFLTSYSNQPTVQITVPKELINYTSSSDDAIALFNTYLANQKTNNTPVRFVYDLYTTIEETITDSAVFDSTTIDNFMIFFADTGSLELSYQNYGYYLECMNDDDNTTLSRTYNNKNYKNVALLN